MENFLDDWLLACSVKRYGLNNWEMVATSFSNVMSKRREHIIYLSPSECQFKYQNLKRLFKNLYQLDFNEEENGYDENAFVNLMADKLTEIHKANLTEDANKLDASCLKKSHKLYKLEAEARLNSGDKSHEKILENINVNQDFIKVLDELRSHKHCCLFETRLASQDMEHYMKIIKQHMDLQIIQNKLEQDVYSNLKIDFFKDLLLMFSNAIVYYPKGTIQHAAAVELRAIVMREMCKKSSPPPTPHPVVVCGLAAMRNTALAQPKWERKASNARSRAQNTGESSSRRRSARLRNDDEATELKNDPDYKYYGYKGRQGSRNMKK